VLGIFTCAFLYVQKTPRYSLYQLKNALVAKDTGMIFKYIDVESITDNLANRFFAHIEKKSEKGREGASRSAGKDMFLRALPAMKNDLKRQMKDQLKLYIEDEQWLNAVKKTSIWIFDVKTDGNMAQIIVNKKPRFIMVKTPEGYWKITDIMIQ